MPARARGNDPRCVGYCDIQQLRDEGVPVSVGDPVLTRRIALATSMIDMWTGRWFEPRDLTIRVDGSGTPALLLGPPIISVTSIKLLFQDFVPGQEEIDLQGVRIYNRHLAGFTDEDDRENPRVEWLLLDLGPREGNRLLYRTGTWPIGKQNIEIEGVFGYTDADVGGSDVETGVTPPLIQHACMLLVIRNLALLADTAAREDAVRAPRVTSLRTRDQSVTYASGNSTRTQGAFSGDPEIDNIIAAYCRQPRLGAA